MKDLAIKNALEKTTGASFAADEIVVGTAKNHVAVAFNNTTYNQNQIIVLQQRDAQALFSVLFQAGKKGGWIV